MGEVKDDRMDRCVDVLDTFAVLMVVVTVSVTAVVAVVMGTTDVDVSPYSEKVVRQTSKGYVTTVAHTPAIAPAQNDANIIVWLLFVTPVVVVDDDDIMRTEDCDCGGCTCSSNGCNSRSLMVLYIENCTAVYVIHKYMADILPRYSAVIPPSLCTIPCQLFHIDSCGYNVITVP
jgi:hypothetical protein